MKKQKSRSSHNVWLGKMVTMFLLLFMVITSCSPKIYTYSLQDQRNKHTQKIVQKDITKGRIFVFACIGIGLWIGANVVKE